MANRQQPPVILFGYDSSAFTQKVRLSLRLKQIPYTFITVPSMMPRPLVVNKFHLTYRKIPILAIGRDLYCDTSLILEILEQTFPESSGYGTLYPKDISGRSNRSLIRGFASYWTDRPFFRITTGLMPASVWRSHFGTDRAGLIGHKLDPEKLEAKIPRNLSGLDMHLSMFETHFSDNPNGKYTWVFSTEKPSAADVSLYYQLDWGNDIAQGKGVEDLTGGGAEDGGGEGAGGVFSRERYPFLWSWFYRFREYVASLPELEEKFEGRDEIVVNRVIESLNGYPKLGADRMIRTPAGPLSDLDSKIGLSVGQGIRVSVAPDDTGRDDPTIGTLVGLSPEEVVIEPVKFNGRETPVDVAIHFPKIGFVIKPVGEAKL